MFDLHSQLKKDCEILGDYPLCRVLLCKDSLYPWLILVPLVEGATEIHQLSAQQQQQLMIESSHTAKCMSDYHQADKMNIAALGNMVPQLHIHHIVRFKTDAAWPSPVWGVKAPELYDEEVLSDSIDSYRALLGSSAIKFSIWAENG